MIKIGKLLAGVALVAAIAVAPVSAKELKFAFQGDAQGLDPHGLNETFSLGFLSNVYEGLALYDENLGLQPGLATEWTPSSPTSWNVKLRKGVTFHNGNTFNADDVIFSWKRALSKASDQKARAGLVTEIKKIDDHTIEMVTAIPTPTLMQEWVFILLLDKEWAEENNTAEATDVSDANASNYGNLHTNGTGPFKITKRQSGVETIFERFDNHWGDLKTNITKATFTPIKEAPTRVAALLSGQVDVAWPIPVQDWDRLNNADGVRALTGAEARTIFLGMDQIRDELLYSNIKGKNPLKDVRVRKAFAHAINLDAIKKRIMRGASTPTGLMVAPQINGFDAALNTPYAYDPEMSKKLLAEAGYADGFQLAMDCPNDRYVNDEKICQAVVGMLAKVGVTVDLNAQTKSKYFGKVLAQNGYDTSFYLLGWTPGSIDSHNVLSTLIACRQDKKGGLFNLGGYCNEEVDKLTLQVASETDAAKRQALISKAFAMVQADVGYLPIHQQPLSWGASDRVDVAQRADNVFDLRNAVVK